MARSISKQEPVPEENKQVLAEAQWIDHIREQIMMLQMQAGKRYGIYFDPEKNLSPEEIREAPGDLEALWKESAEWRKKNNLYITDKIWNNLEELDKKLEKEPTIKDIGKAAKILKKFLYPTSSYINERNRIDYRKRRTTDFNRSYGDNPYYENYNYDLPFDERYEFKGKSSRERATQEREKQERNWPEGTFPQVVPRSKDPLGRRFAPTQRKRRGGKIKKSYARGGGIRRPKQ